MYREHDPPGRGVAAVFGGDKIEFVFATAYLQNLVEPKGGAHPRSRRSAAVVFFIFVAGLLACWGTACARTAVVVQTKQVNSAASPRDTLACYAIFDAGSSGTRLHVYTQLGQEWVHLKSQSGMGALSEAAKGDSNDFNNIAKELVLALATFKAQKHDCELRRVSVLATAGMRLAEQASGKNSAKLYRRIHDEISTFTQDLPSKPEIEVRTLSGFEEGLFAWLSVREDSNKFVLAEMGGASAQLAFPCPNCEAFAKPVLIDDKPVKFFSYSFLGLGANEAPTKVGTGDACRYGAGVDNGPWKPEDCESQMKEIRRPHGILDPDNIDSHAAGGYVDVPISEAEDLPWKLAGSFQYMENVSVENCCRRRADDACFGTETSCHRAVYLPYYLRSVGGSGQDYVSPSWTLGALICAESNCLKLAGNLKCRWQPEGKC